jgi:hypothetical protein
MGIAAMKKRSRSKTEGASMTGFNSKREAAADKLQEPPIDFVLAYGDIFAAQRAALKEALAQPAQEPVAHVYLFDQDGRPLIAWNNAKGIKIGDKLYTTLLQRQWIGLSDADIAEVVDTTCQYTGGYEEFLIKKAERKIRSMNT